MEQQQAALTDESEVNRLTTMDGSQPETSEQMSEEEVSGNGESDNSQDSIQQGATPVTLRKDSSNMADAIACMAEWGLTDIDDAAEHLAIPQRWRNRPRKSGAVSTDLAQLRKAVASRVKQAFRPATRKNLFTHLRLYFVFCRHFNLPDLLASTANLLLFAEFLTHSYASPSPLLMSWLVCAICKAPLSLTSPPSQPIRWHCLWERSSSCCGTPLTRPALHPGTTPTPSTLWGVGAWSSRRCVLQVILASPGGLLCCP